MDKRKKGWLEGKTNGQKEERMDRIKKNWIENRKDE